MTGGPENTSGAFSDLAENLLAASHGIDDQGDGAGENIEHIFARACLERVAFTLIQLQGGKVEEPHSARLDDLLKLSIFASFNKTFHNHLDETVVGRGWCGG